MDPVTALAVGSVVAGAYGAYQSSKAQKEANQANVGMSGEQMKFQKYMSDTAHQREVADLKKAGLNPLLSAGGSGASSPSGSMTTVSPTVDPGPASALGGLKEGVNSGLSAINLKKDLAQKDANLALTNMQKDATEAQRELNASNAMKNWNETNRYTEDTEVRNLNRQALKAEARTRMLNSKVDQARAETDFSMHKFDSLNRRFQSGLGTVNSAIDIIKPLRPGGGSNRSHPTGYTEEQYDRQGEHVGSRSRRYNY